MKKFASTVLVLILVAGFATLAHAGLEDSLRRLNDQAKADISRFNVQISAQFGVPVPTVQDVLKRMPSPADAFMVFHLGMMTAQPPQTVIQTFERHRGQGWGVIAKDLGIKPGSAEFHQLKNGDFALTGRPGGGDHGKEHGKGHGHGRGHND